MKKTILAIFLSLFVAAACEAKVIPIQIRYAEGVLLSKDCDDHQCSLLFNINNRKTIILAAGEANGAVNFLKKRHIGKRFEITYQLKKSFNSDTKQVEDYNWLIVDKFREIR